MKPDKAYQTLLQARGEYNAARTTLNATAPRDRDFPARLAAAAAAHARLMAAEFAAKEVKSWKV